jgi:hypothetical protein
MSKHPAIPDVDLKLVRDLFRRHGSTNNRLMLATTIDFLNMPAVEADNFLRNLAMTGYLEWVQGDFSGHEWDLTDYGLRLAADDLLPKMLRTALDSVINTLLARCRNLNSDPGNIVRIGEIRLFGSALDQDRAE